MSNAHVDTHQAEFEPADSFRPDGEGFVRHWLCVGPGVTPYAGSAQSEQAVRREVIDPAVIPPPAGVALGRPGPLGQNWRFYQPGRNVFVEMSGFYHELSRLEMLAATDLLCDEPAELTCRVWTANTLDLWCGGEHVLRYTSALHRKPDVTAAALPLRAGRNRLVVRVQELAARECPFLFGLQLPEAGQGVRVALSGEPDATRTMRQADRWFDALRTDDGQTLTAPEPPGFAVTVALSGRAGGGPGGPPDAEIAWPADAASLSWATPGVTSAEVSADVTGQAFRRRLELPCNLTMPASPARPLDEHRRAFLERIASRPRGSKRPVVTHVLARHALGGDPAGQDAADVDEALAWIDRRPDCADFALAAVIRLYGLGWGDEAARARVRRTMLAFRYWEDEPGSDAMCFGSENHALLFHGCQYAAGLLLPDEAFTNTGRSGRQHARIGRQRCVDWLDRRRREGFVEFLSSTYLPITMAALMNLVDLADDEAVSRQAAGLADEIFGALAEHSFDGVTVGPQGRVYRGIIYPHASSAQGLLSYAAPGAVAADCDWAAFVASSRRYEPPAGLAERMARPVSRSYPQADVRIHLHKTPHSMVSSLAIPRDEGGGAGAAPGGGLRPGEAGYQQHLWHATLARDAHVFVNHPGASFDFSSARPGFWYGNGVLPRLRQTEATVAAIYSIPPTHPIQFTHAHWPADAFDAERQADGWHVARKGASLIALWCSQPTRRVSEVLTDRELRADGSRAAWVCICSDVEQAGGLDAFADACRQARPRFDEETLALEMGGANALRWG